MHLTEDFTDFDLVAFEEKVLLSFYTSTNVTLSFTYDRVSFFTRHHHRHVQHRRHFHQSNHLYNKQSCSHCFAKELAQLGMPQGIVMRHRPTHFQHLFSGSHYAAGYHPLLLLLSLFVLVPSLCSLACCVSLFSVLPITSAPFAMVPCWYYAV